MKRAGGSGGGGGGSKAPSDGKVIDLTGESSQDSDQEPEQKKAKCDEVKKGHKVKDNERKEDVDQRGHGGAGPSRQDERRKDWKSRGFTPANGFPGRQPGGGWGGGQKQRVAGERNNEMKSSENTE